MHPCNFLPVLRASTSIIFQLLRDWSDKNTVSRLIFWLHFNLVSYQLSRRSLYVIVMHIAGRSGGLIRKYHGVPLFYPQSTWRGLGLSAEGEGAQNRQRSSPGCRAIRQDCGGWPVNIISRAEACSLRHPSTLTDFGVWSKILYTVSKDV